MDNSEIEKYKREMMRLYGRSNTMPEEANQNADPKKTEPPRPVIEEANQNEAPERLQVEKMPFRKSQHPVSTEIEDVNKNAPDDTIYSPYKQIEEDFPEPDLSEFEKDLGQYEMRTTAQPDYPTEESMGNSVGYIIVNTRTGEQSSPVENASILITAVIDGRREIIASGLTDESGTSRRFAVPAPDLAYSQSPEHSTRPYSLFDISVTAKGFFNARSVDVPVFSGITSVQNFSMIPVPLMMKSADETVTYINQEPDFPDIR
ncbi:MAG: carboxypeptidase regulatory-like domain-containing protein [Ruminococcus sp.]|nr:carboxypeptidase regulatory-like domain-containing protein [Ruminococcus sp.]